MIHSWQDFVDAYEALKGELERAELVRATNIEVDKAEALSLLQSAWQDRAQVLENEIERLKRILLEELSENKRLKEMLGSVVLYAEEHLDYVFSEAHALLKE